MSRLNYMGPRGICDLGEGLCMICTYLSSQTGYGECLTFDSFLGDIPIDLWAKDELR